MIGMVARGYHVSLTCPECGSPVAHVADGTTTGRDARAVAKCVSCLRSWVVVVQLGVAGRMTK